MRRRCLGDLGGPGPSGGGWATLRREPFATILCFDLDSISQNRQNCLKSCVHNRSGIHLDGSSFRLSSSRNQSDDDSSDAKPGAPCKDKDKW